MSAALKERLAKLKAAKAEAAAAAALRSSSRGRSTPRSMTDGNDPLGQSQDTDGGLLSQSMQPDSPSATMSGATGRLLGSRRGSLTATAVAVGARMRAGLGQGEGFNVENKANKVPEVHILGSIVGGVGFTRGVSVRWSLVCGRGWEHLEGTKEGQSQFDYPHQHGDKNDRMSVWAHPVDVHFTTRTLQGWPRLLCHIWQLDEHGCCSLIGYGQTAIPASPGHHEIAVNTWRPTGTPSEELLSFFIGGTPRLKTDEVLYAKAWEDRCRISTVSCGIVYAEFSVLMKNFKEAGIDLVE
eukprot:g1424.t1